MAAVDPDRTFVLDQHCGASKNQAYSEKFSKSAPITENALVLYTLQTGFGICLFGPSAMQPQPLLGSLSDPFLKLFV